MNKLEIEVILREELNQLVEVDGEVTISAIGYDYLNKVTELSFLAPDTLTINGQEMNNPYIVYDNDESVKKAIYKCIAYGMGPLGNRVLTSATVEFNPDVQLLKDLTYVVCNDAEAGRITKEPLLTQEDKELGYSIPLKDDLIVYCKLNNADINKAFEIYSNNKAYAERIAQTMAKRNALKVHPALSNLITSVEGVKDKRTAKVHIMKFYDDFDKDKILEYLKTQNIQVLKDEYIELGTQIYESYEITSPAEEINNNEQQEIEKKKIILLEILKEIDKNKLMKVIRDLGLYEKDKKISQFTLKQLELITSNLD